MNIEKIQVPANWVCVEIDDSNEFVKLGDEKIKLDTTFEPEKNAQTVGRLVKVCSHLTFNPTSSTTHDYDVDIEVVKGDTVVFHFMTVLAARKHGKTFTQDGKEYVFMPYERLFVALRDGEVLPLNGIILVEPLEEVPSTSLAVPEIAIKNSKTTGIVRYAGMKCRGYAGIHKDFGEDPDVPVGSKILFKTQEAIPLQYEFHSIISKNLYRMHRKDVLAIIN